AIVQALIDRGVIGDYREPGILRFGFTPLYTRFVEVWDAVQALLEILQSEAWKEPRYQVRHKLT
ncbi:kynureninase, partial [Pseudomonas aeruginosa]